ncbi:hypothetical protein DSO57_1020319 [Entomophthora muscae]|uniref:Uncharacterized protein n=1 Tax=Entomophthora muscae TaxID=34485 RepID=A0ACC2TS58_9FUNG|nr:hypothetical protein DSO57_1020319 [Entomophthora muscae]
MSEAALSKVQRHKAQVFSIYRQLLRLSYDQPIDHLRPNRQFRNELLEHISTTFHENKSLEIESPKTQEIIADAYVQIAALEAINSDKYRTEYPLSQKLLSPASNPIYYENLVKDLATATPMKPFTWIQKVRMFFNMSPV